jgi:nicotinate-nucleotide adenylyltransferase
MDYDEINYTCAIVLTGQGPDMKLLLQNHDQLPMGLKKTVDPLLACMNYVEEISGIRLSRDKAIALNRRAHTLPFLFYLEESPEEGDWVPLIRLKKLENPHGQMLCEAIGKFWPRMPSFKKELGFINLPNLFYKKNLHEDKETIFFPGSFNPWHAGHRACLDLAPKESSIIVVPDFNPWKDREDVQTGCGWEKYMTLALGLKDTPYSVFPGFLGLEKSNPTVDWLPFTRIEKKVLLVGDDSFLSLEKWKETDKLISFLSKIYVVPRESDTKQIESTRKKLLEQRPNLEIVILPNHPHQDVSSTKIRNENN